MFRCLEKDREARYASGGELLADLQALRTRLGEISPRVASLLRRPRFRCARYAKALPDSLTRELQSRPGRDHSKERPASDELFAVYKGFYTFDRTPLASRIESVHDDSPHWLDRQLGPVQAVPKG